MDLLTKNVTAFFSAALISRLLCCCSLLKDFTLPTAVEMSSIKRHVKYAISFFFLLLFFLKRLCLMGIGGDLQLSYLAIQQAHHRAAVTHRGPSAAFSFINMRYALGSGKTDMQNAVFQKPLMQNVSAVHLCYCAGCIHLHFQSMPQLYRHGGTIVAVQSE